MNCRLFATLILAGAMVGFACDSGGANGNSNAGQGGRSGSGGDGGSTGKGGGSSGGTAGSTANGGASGGTAGSTANGGASGGAAGGGGNTSGGGAGGSVDPGTPISFTVDPSQDNHAISPYIYCQSERRAADTATVTDLARNNGLRLVRVGGNRFSAYNWENNASNAGSDYQFQNDDFVSTSDVPGAAMEGALATADTGLVATILTGQLGDYVAADKKGGGDVTATTDYLATRFKKNVLNKSSALSSTPDATDDSVYQDEFLGWVQSVHAKSKVLVALDNEPDLWDATHKEIWPTTVSYDEFIKRDVAYAKMARKQFPKAELLGYASYGWYGWTTFQDKYKDGDFLDYYLDKMKAGESDVGGRAIDYLDVHWYSEARGVAGDAKTRVTSGGTSDAEIQARVQAPRSLWDSSYVETSWISDGLKTSEPDGKGAIALLPRLKKQIADHYPGTKLAIAEWNYGADAHISGGIATADALGIFGRESVDLACNWYANPDFYFRDGAYQIFGNYDSKGSHFGDTSVGASAADVSVSSIYAAKDSADAQRLTIVAINKDTAPHVAKISIKGDTMYKSALVYVLSAAAQDTYNKAAHPQLATSVTTTTANEISVPLPAQSVAVVVPSTDATPPTGPSWPPPAVVTETGWTFDNDEEGWTVDTASLKPPTLAAKLDWNATEGKPKAGCLSLEIPFTDRPQQAQITMADQKIDLTGKKLKMNVRRKGAFDGGIMFFAGSASDKSWTMAGWSMLPSEEWTTIVFDPVAAKTENPDFDPTAVLYLGAIFATGDKGDTTPGTVTFYIDQIVVASAD
jgi:hypothetical protein